MSAEAVTAITPMAPPASVTWLGLKPPYATIVADPPWRYERAGITKVDSRKFYSTMPIADICALPVQELVDRDAHLWLWALNGLMEEAHQVVRAWGFKPVQLVTWCKPGPGVGHYLRSNTEHAIFATRGRPVTPDAKPLSTWYRWPRGQHSAKPAAFGDLVEQVSPGPYVELFARAQRLGWDGWGWGYDRYGSAPQPTAPAVTLGPRCATCTRQFTPARSDARYCSNACRQKAYRQRGGQP